MALCIRNRLKYKVFNCLPAAQADDDRADTTRDDAPTTTKDGLAIMIEEGLSTTIEDGPVFWKEEGLSTMTEGGLFITIEEGLPRLTVMKLVVLAPRLKCYWFLQVSGLHHSSYL